MKTLIAFMLLAGSVVAQDFPAGVYPGAKAAELPGRYPRVIYFSQKSCPPCVPRWLDLVTYVQPSGWMSGYNDQCNLQMIYAEESPQLAEQAGVTTTPAVALLTRDGIGRAIPYSGRIDLITILNPKAKAATAESFDLKRVGCKLRPDLGSGVNTDQGVVTCWHCVNGYPLIVECDGETAIGTVVAYDATADVAILSVPWKQPHPAVEISSVTATGPLSCVARSPEGPISVQSTAIIGKSFDNKLMVEMAFVSGQSGGALLDRNGDLVGIVSGNVVATEPFRGLVIPANAIQQLLGRLAR